jgi:hypothetical protein
LKTRRRFTKLINDEFGARLEATGCGSLGNTVPGVAYIGAGGGERTAVESFNASVGEVARERKREEE